MKFPYFYTDYDEQGRHWSVDFRFCQDAKKNGFKIYVDPEIEIPHIGDHSIVTKDTFIKYYNNLIKNDKTN
jgi:hypothetical protein